MFSREFVFCINDTHAHEKDKTKSKKLLSRVTSHGQNWKNNTKKPKRCDEKKREVC